MKIMKFVAALTLLIVMSNMSWGQSCRAFAKKDCRPQMAPYIHNGQLNTATLFPGDKADILLTFYSGQKYRILVCSQEQLQGLAFRILDTDRNEVYNSKNKKSNTFDFKVASTQQLIVEVTVPEAKAANGIESQGCVSIMVGFME
jgi:hypothetical protein